MLKTWIFIAHSRSEQRECRISLQKTSQFGFVQKSYTIEPGCWFGTMCRMQCKYSNVIDKRYLVYVVNTLAGM